MCGAVVKAWENLHLQFWWAWLDRWAEWPSSVPPPEKVKLDFFHISNPEWKTLRYHIYLNVMISFCFVLNYFIQSKKEMLNRSDDFSTGIICLQGICKWQQLRCLWKTKAGASLDNTKLLRNISEEGETEYKQVNWSLSGCLWMR